MTFSKLKGRIGTDEIIEYGNTSRDADDNT